MNPRDVHPWFAKKYPTYPKGDGELAEDEEVAVSKIYMDGGLDLTRQPTEKDIIAHTVIPSDYIEGGLKGAAKNLRKGMKSDAALVKSALTVEPMVIPLENEGYEVFGKWALNHASAGVVKQVWTVRPLFPTWSCEFTIVSSDDKLGAGKIRQLVEEMGLHVGIGSWRPKFGQFRLVSIEEAA
jgi:hypothetical protein